MTDFTYSHPSPDSIARDASDKLIEVISVLDFIPETYHAAIRARTSAVDVAAYVQNAIDHIDSTANAPFYGGQLFFPRGKYILGSTLNLCRGLNLVGEGRIATFLVWTQAGSNLATGTGLRMSSPVNSSTSVYLTIRDISLLNTASSPQGAGFWDTGGSLISATRATFYGFKYGIILEQSELVDISECECSGMAHSGVWLVNGNDLGTGAVPDYTNRISIRSSQFNGCAQFGILDDGGNCHAFVDNNYNANGVHIRVAVANGVRIAGGEFESSTTNPIQMRAASLSGAVTGGNSGVLIEGTIIAPSNQSAISCVGSTGQLCLVGNYFGNTGSGALPEVDGVENLSGFYSIGNSYTSSGGTMIDAEANDQQVFLEAARHGSATYDPPSLALGASSPVQTMTVNQVALGDQVESASLSNNLAGAVLHAWVSAANTVSYFIHNLNGANPLDLASGTVRVRVMKRIF